jgi:hypothetical protein
MDEQQRITLNHKAGLESFGCAQDKLCEWNGSRFVLPLKELLCVFVPLRYAVSRR